MAVNATYPAGGTAWSGTGGLIRTYRPMEQGKLVQSATMAFHPTPTNVEHADG